MVDAQALVLKLNVKGSRHGLGLLIVDSRWGEAALSGLEWVTFVHDQLVVIDYRDYFNAAHGVFQLFFNSPNRLLEHTPRPGRFTCFARCSIERRLLFFQGLNGLLILQELLISHPVDPNPPHLNQPPRPEELRVLGTDLRV